MNDKKVILRNITAFMAVFLLVICGILCYPALHVIAAPAFSDAPLLASYTSDNIPVSRTLAFSSYGENFYSGNRYIMRCQISNPYYGVEGSHITCQDAYLVIQGQKFYGSFVYPVGYSSTLCDVIFDFIPDSFTSYVVVYVECQVMSTSTLRGSSSGTLTGGGGSVTGSIDVPTYGFSFNSTTPSNQQTNLDVQITKNRLNEYEYKGTIKGYLRVAATGYINSHLETISMNYSQNLSTFNVQNTATLLYTPASSARLSVLHFEQMKISQTLGERTITAIKENTDAVNRIASSSDTTNNLLTQGNGLQQTNNQQQLQQTQTIKDQTTTITNQTNNMMNGYDNSGLGNTNDKLSGSVAQYDQAENNITSSAVAGMNAFVFDDYLSFAAGTSSAMTFVGSFINSCANASGDFFSVVMIWLCMMFITILIGIWRFRGG